MIYYELLPHRIHIIVDSIHTRISRSSLTSMDVRGQTPLHRAAPYAHAETGRFLLDSGAEINARDLQGDLHTSKGYILLIYLK